MSSCIVIITTFFNRNPSVLDSLISFKEIFNSNSPVRLERVAKVPSVFSKKILWFVMLIIHSLSDLQNNLLEELVFHLFLVVQSSHFYSF